MSTDATATPRSSSVRWSLVLNPGFSEQANEEHRALLDAVRARDGERAAEIEAKHLRATLSEIMNERSD